MGRAYVGKQDGKRFLYELNNLTRHATVLGTTGSGKTVICKVLMEEVLSKNIPVIAIDPKGDIGSLAIVDKDFDFRPFIGKSIKQAEKIAENYEADEKKLSSLSKVKTKIFTPKSHVGVPTSLIPNLSSPKDFKKISEDNPNIVADFIEPVSESIVKLAGISGTKKEKAQSLISNIIDHYWKKDSNLTIERLIIEIRKPPFADIGSLPLDDFLNEKERLAIASQVNLIISSPAKKAWKHGEKINVGEMFSKGRLSVFDLRHASTNEEKQYVTEQLLQEIYKFIMKKGGSERLRFILYIDELAGLLPPPPANPPSKRLLELLIRQARAFGLGIIVATQSPGDIDYRIFGNMGTRFIGRLRTDRDVEKVATAMALPPSKLKEDVSKLTTGEFIFNDAVKNKTKLMKSRWLLSYHGGPLKDNEVKWINNPETIPKKEGKISKNKKVRKKTEKKPKKSKKISAETLVRSLEKKKTVSISKKTKKNISSLLKQARKYSDKLQLRINLSEEKIYVPHLKIVIEAKDVNGIELEKQGPYVFDLSTKLIPLKNYLKGYVWSTFVPNDIDVEKHIANIKRAYDFSIKEAKHDLKTHYFKSNICKFTSRDRDDVENVNHKKLMEEVKLRIRQLENRKQKDISLLNDKIAKNKKKISSYRASLRKSKAGRSLKRFIHGKKLAKETKEMKEKRKKIDKIKRENVRIRKRISDVRYIYAGKRDKLKDKAYSKAHTAVKKLTYNPKRPDLIVYSTIYLIPKRKNIIK